MTNRNFLDKYKLFVNIIKTTILFFLCILLISCGLTKTGTIADVNYHPNFFTGRAEVPVENGKTAKIILGREGPSNKVKVIDIKNKYIEKASARIEPITEKSKDKKVTVDVIIKGESKEVQIPEIIKKGYGGVLSLHLKKDIPTLEGMKFEIITSERQAELLAEYSVKEKRYVNEITEGFFIKNFFLVRSTVIGEGRELIRGDRGYLYVFKVTLKFENGEINETYIPSSSWFYDGTNKYTLGYITY